ncbi:hypothetical protein HYN59_00155 [Flavobacterium album]|uniref:Lipocalin-like domain-containing protein n=1 Tax=Flavobacterium album TaxID=2175091 RepID=A0A2S1QTQ2_9FLAO|nr:lipocalin family protein [Flavobacterium album]AWH83621.1 hypothetical protein HYN59_00155 [Flavobacterium album]
MKFKNLMLALAVTLMLASCGEKKEGDAAKEGTEAAAKTEEAKTEETPAADAKTMITKTWIIEEMDPTAMIAKEPKEKQEEMKKKMAETMAKVKGNMIYEFKADGRFAMTIKDTKDITTEGTWSISDDGKTLTMAADTEKDKKEEVNVLTLTDDKLDIQMKSEPDMIMKFVAKK